MRRSKGAFQNRCGSLAFRAFEREAVCGSGFHEGTNLPPLYKCRRGINFNPTHETGKIRWLQSSRRPRSGQRWTGAVGRLNRESLYHPGSLESGHHVLAIAIGFGALWAICGPVGGSEEGYRISAAINLLTMSVSW